MSKKNKSTSVILQGLAMNYPDVRFPEARLKALDSIILELSGKWEMCPTIIIANKGRDRTN